MKYECDVIEDLLPLYKDGACSEASTRAVEEHIKECPKCAKILNALEDTKIDELIVRERDNIIGSQSRYFKRKSAVAGMVVAAIFALPILICLIVNLASGHGLTWFFIVLASMMIPTSLFVVPLMAPKNRMFWTMISFTASLIILLAVCCIYSRGTWFFVAASSVLFGLSICFMPFIACRRPVNEYLKNFKGLTVMAVDTLTFFLMILCIGLHVHVSGFFGTALSISVPIIMMCWGIFFIIRYLKVNGMTKAGICITALSLFGHFGTKAILYLTLKNSGNGGVQVYSEPSMMGVIVGLIVGVVFILIGMLLKNKGEKNNDQI